MHPTNYSHGGSGAGAAGTAHRMLQGVFQRAHTLVREFVRGDDEEQENCSFCSTRFSAGVTADRCRRCLRVFCNTYCLSHRLVLDPVAGRLEKVCPSCYLHSTQPQRLPLAPSPMTRRRKNVLCVDGGGLRGVHALVMLREIERLTGHYARDLFDLCVGTSTGGFIAMGSGVFGLSADDGIAVYTAIGSNAFCLDPAVRAGGRAAQLMRPHKYLPTPLNETLISIFGAESMLLCKQPRVALVAVKWDEKPSPAYLFRSYAAPPTPDALRGNTAPTLAWTAARASSAAPTYFPPHNIDGQWFADGGLVANNPSLIALAEACALYGGMDSINAVVSLGTGRRAVELVARAPQPNVLDLARDLVKTCINSDVTADSLTHILGAGRFFRFNGEIAQSEMDRADLMPQWIAEAEAYIAQPTVQQRLKELCQTLMKEM
eukprot:m.172710 g.172710  ORF g.172710 m.172710 type:complete len:432 (-) comp17301_c0_seq6:485-1780(-)